jgi:hypothetical protein
MNMMMMMMMMMKGTCEKEWAQLPSKLGHFGFGLPHDFKSFATITSLTCLVVYEQFPQPPLSLLHDDSGTLH